MWLARAMRAGRKRDGGFSGHNRVCSFHAARTAAWSLSLVAEPTSVSTDDRLPATLTLGVVDSPFRRVVAAELFVGGVTPLGIVGGIGGQR